MNLSGNPHAVLNTQKISHAITRWFPTPTLIFPRAAGIDISDASIKWLVLQAYEGGYRVELFGEEPISSGAVVNGMIQDVEALGMALRNVKKNLGSIECAHAALPEEAAYVFEMHIPEGMSREEILHMIEFEFDGRVPIPPSATVFDFDVIQHHDEGDDIAVAVFPRELAESYVVASTLAGINLLSLEIEARSIARAVSSTMTDEPITLLVDFGHARTGFAVLRQGIPIFTSTVEIGCDGIDRVLVEKFSMSHEDARIFRNEQGLTIQNGVRSPVFDAIVGIASSLADEVARHYHYWDTRRNEHGDRMTPVERIVLVGGGSNLLGLCDYISERVHAQTILGDVWQNVCDFDEYIPPISHKDSLQYATSIGLALRSLES